MLTARRVHLRAEGGGHSQAEEGRYQAVILQFLSVPRAAKQQAHFPIHRSSEGEARSLVREKGEEGCKGGEGGVGGERSERGE